MDQKANERNPLQFLFGVRTDVLMPKSYLARVLTLAAVFCESKQS